MLLSRLPLAQMICTTWAGRCCMHACIYIWRVRQKCFLNQFDLFEVKQSGFHTTLCTMAHHVYGNFTLQGIIIIHLLKNSSDSSDQKPSQSLSDITRTEVYHSYHGAVKLRITTSAQCVFLSNLNSYVSFWYSKNHHSQSALYADFNQLRFKNVLRKNLDES